MKIKSKLSAIALATVLSLTSYSTMGFSQGKVSDELADQGNDLTGVWQVAAAATVDCKTGQPDPGSPQVRILYSFNQGGTMSEEEAQPFDGPYRASAHGIWKRTLGQSYTAVYTNFVFDPDRTFVAVIKQWTKIALSPDRNSFSERGTFEIRAPDDTLIYAGCFADTATRFGF